MACPPARRTELYNAYKDWCAFNRINPVSARRLYGSVWEIFRVEMQRSNGRGVLRGLKIVDETTATDADGGRRGTRGTKGAGTIS